MLVQIGGVVSKCISLQEGFCRIAGAGKNARVSVSSWVLAAWWDRATTGVTGGGAAPWRSQHTGYWADVCVSLLLLEAKLLCWVVVLFTASSSLSPCSEDPISALLLPPIPAFSLFQVSALEQSSEAWPGLLSLPIGSRAEAL